MSENLAVGQVTITLKLELEEQDITKLEETVAHSKYTLHYKLHIIQEIIAGETTHRNFRITMDRD